LVVAWQVVAAYVLGQSLLQCAFVLLAVLTVSTALQLARP
jgi:hypothetical protein